MVSRPSRFNPPMECIRLFDADAKLDGFIVIHSTTLGPGAGGCRLSSYAEIEDALHDALKLSEAMNYKHALAGLPFGGAKAILRKPEGDFDRGALFRAFGRVVESLDGLYVTAEDVGTTVDDMREVAGVSRHVAGLKPNAGRGGNTSSAWTALGVLEAMCAAARFALGRDLKGLTVAVQGTGNVGAELCRRLDDAGARIVIADPRPERRDRLHHILGAQVVGVDDIVTVEADIFAPCGGEGTIDENTAGRIAARIICGGANNQLASATVGELLMRRGITYVPDYVANAGGIICATSRYLEEDESRIRRRIGKIATRVDSILRRAAKAHCPTVSIADEMAEQKIAEAFQHTLDTRPSSAIARKMN